MEPKVILVIDDDQNTIRSVAGALEPCYRVVGAATSENAFAFAEKTAMHLAIISCEGSGLASLAILREMAAKFPTLPVALTANAAGKELIVSAFRAGARDFLEKPLTKEALLESVNRLLGTAEKDAPVSGLATKLRRSWKRMNFSGLHFSLKQWGAHIAAVTRHFPFGLFSAQSTELCNKNNGTLVKSPEPPSRLEPTIESGPEKITSLAIEPSQEEKKAGLVLRVHCLGRFQVFLNDRLINHWPCRKGKELFAYLAINHNKRAHREVLMENFWPDSSPDSARNSLNVALHGIRAQLREPDLSHPIILYDEECYFLNPEIEMRLDVEEFQRHWSTAQRAVQEKHSMDAIANYESAAALYQGDFLEDDPYASWPAQQRENLKEIYLVILDRLGEHYALDGRPDTAINLCEKILEKDVCREDVYRRLMKCYYRLGQRDKALRTFQKCGEALKKELEAEPTRATVQLYEQVKQDCLKKI